MQHTFFQKLILVILAGALTAGFYEVVYKGLILDAENSVNGAYKTVPANSFTHKASPRRY